MDNDNGTELKRKLVTVEQLNTLLEFMKQNRDLARGLSRGRRGKLFTVKEWNTCAKKLNAMIDGAVKDGKGWSKYWCDWKYKVRRHALELRVANERGRKTGPMNTTPLSPLEQTIMDIMGDNTLDGVVINTDPSANDDESHDEDIADGDDAEQNIDGENGNEENANDDLANMVNQYFVTSKRHKLKRRRSQDDVNMLEDDSGSPPLQKLRITNNTQDHDESDNDDGDDHSAKFLRLEQLQLRNAKLIQQSVKQISLEICRLTDIMGEIRDVLVKNIRNIT